MSIRIRSKAIYVFTDARMLPAACCALLSVERNSQKNDIKLVIVGIDLPEDQKAGVATFNAVNGIDIDVVDFTFPTDTPETAGRWHKSTLARLYLDKLMGEELERVLYLDADILAVGNVDPLFDVNLNGKAIGAVPSQIRGMVLRQAFRHVGIGVLVGVAFVVAWDAVFIPSARARAVVPGASLTDPCVLLIIAGVLAAITVLSCLVPLGRAQRIEPGAALRVE